jgi:hypothetical protein
VGSILGLVSLLGLPLAIYLYFKARRAPALSYQVSEFTVVGSETAKFPDELEIRFGGAPVGQVTSTEFFIWNSGNTTIHGNQIVRSDPLRVALREGEILKATVSRATRDVIGVSAEAGHAQNTHHLRFEYLDPNDGFVVRVVHSGPRHAASCSGTIKELPRGIACVRTLPEDRRLAKRAFTLPTPVLLISGAMLVVMSFVPIDIPRMYSTILPYFFFGAGLIYFAVGAWAVWRERRLYPAALADAPEDRAP